MTERFDHVTEWIRRLDHTVELPPYCLELFLRDGRSYYVRAVIAHDDQTESVVFRIWDTRAIGQREIDELLSTLNDLKRKEQGVIDPTSLHPKLDQANLRVHLADVAYCIEWHDRYWPDEVKGRFGFHGPEG